MPRPRRTRGADARLELGGLEGLLKIVVGAEIKALHPVGDGVARRPDQHGHIGASSADAAQHLEPGEAGHVEIKDDQPVGLAEGDRRRVGAVRLVVDGKASQSQRRNEPARQDGVILDD